MVPDPWKPALLSRNQTTSVLQMTRGHLIGGILPQAILPLEDHEDLQTTTPTLVVRLWRSEIPPPPISLYRDWAGAVVPCPLEGGTGLGARRVQSYLKFRSITWSPQWQGAPAPDTSLFFGHMRIGCARWVFRCHDTPS